MIVDRIDQSAWIGIIPSSVSHGSEKNNDAHDLSYKYLTADEGAFTMTAPKTPGQFDLRMHNSDSSSNAKELVSITFNVK